MGLLKKSSMWLLRRSQRWHQSLGYKTPADFYFEQERKIFA